ncbi:hypothetical protein AB1Y20_020011 [Prymnesium parvum]|uniref:Uncharacterized protein n=1 Tax=Prymnesium parvum TaxID=97485 RepID=A0AB34JTZ5_PRYPA
MAAQAARINVGAPLPPGAGLRAPAASGENGFPRSTRSRRSSKRGNDWRHLPVPEGEGPALQSDDNKGRKPPPSEYYGSMAAGSIVGANNGGVRSQQKGPQTQRSHARAAARDGALPKAEGPPQNGRRSGRKAEVRERAGNGDRRGRAQLVQPYEGFIHVVEDARMPLALQKVWCANSVNCFTLYTSPSKSCVKLMVPHRLLRKVATVSLPNEPYGIQISYLNSLSPGARRPMPLPPDEPSVPIDTSQDVVGKAMSNISVLTFTLAADTERAVLLLRLRIALRLEVAFSGDPALTPTPHGTLTVNPTVPLSNGFIGLPMGPAAAPTPLDSSILSHLPNSSMGAALGLGGNLNSYDELVASAAALGLHSDTLTICSRSASLRDVPSPSIAPPITSRMPSIPLLPDAAVELVVSGLQNPVGYDPLTAIGNLRPPEVHYFDPTVMGGDESEDDANIADLAVAAAVAAVLDLPA